MSTEEDVQNQKELLASYRRTLQVYLRQRASIGTDHVTPAIANGIYETRQSIERVKRNLRLFGVEVKSHPDDFGETTEKSTSSLRSSAISGTEDKISRPPTISSDTSFTKDLVDFFTAISHLLSDVFSHLVKTKEIDKPNFTHQWTILTLIGFVVSIFFSAGIYFTSSMSRPTSQVPNPIELLFFLNAVISSMSCGFMQYILLAKIHKGMWIWVPCNLLILSIIKQFTVWPFGFYPLMLLPYVIIILAFQLLLVFLLKWSVRLLQWVYDS